MNIINFISKMLLTHSVILKCFVRCKIITLLTLYFRVLFLFTIICKLFIHWQITIFILRGATCEWIVKPLSLSVHLQKVPHPVFLWQEQRLLLHSSFDSHLQQRIFSRQSGGIKVCRGSWIDTRVLVIRSFSHPCWDGSMSGGSGYAT